MDLSAPKGRFWTTAALLGFTGALVLLFFFAPDRYPFYPRCLFHSLTGWQCPGCGGLRATHCLLHGNLAGAFHFNPLLVTLLPVMLLFAMVAGVKRLTGRDLVHPFRRPAWLWVLFAVVVAFGIGRNLFGT